MVVVVVAGHTSLFNVGLGRGISDVSSDIFTLAFSVGSSDTPDTCRTGVGPSFGLSVSNLLPLVSFLIVICFHFVDWSECVGECAWHLCFLSL